MYAARSAVEREFGRLKHELGMAPLRVRGLERVRLHADLCVLTRLALALQ
ncbi:MAG: transposase [Actinomycetia bacterium]|nr:transposase [Actinomycetes bacterium]